MKIVEQSPVITSNLIKPFESLESKIVAKQCDIEAWFRKKWQEYRAPFYSSVDLRNAGFKLAPVDTNLFPAGFNNLNPDFLSLSIQAVQATFEKLYPGCMRVLIIAESHTRNQFYFESLACLVDMILRAGYEVRIGTLRNISEQEEVILPSGKKLKIFPIHKNNNRVLVSGFEPCVILLNNDLTEGVPEVLKNIEQLIIPSLQLGWSFRRKSGHFAEYNKICDEFSALIDMDPWLINPIFQSCDNVDFEASKNLSCLKSKLEEIFSLIEQKYREHGVSQKPFVVIKADAGTYGMGVITIQDPNEIEHLNRKQRNTMSVTKGGQKIDKVILQEGIYTFETVGDAHAVAEPVIYLIGSYVIGGFYRVHKYRGVTENLNSPGMQFEPLPFVYACNTPTIRNHHECQENRLYVYGVIARLATLAAAKELK
ncbi:MAG: glutamate--cysteine ligase [Gammaproteobacteria bacterium]